MKRLNKIILLLVVQLMFSYENYTFSQTSKIDSIDNLRLVLEIAKNNVQSNSNTDIDSVVYESWDFIKFEPCEKDDSLDLISKVCKYYSEDSLKLIRCYYNHPFIYKVDFDIRFENDQYLIFTSFPYYKNKYKTNTYTNGFYCLNKAHDILLFFSLKINYGMDIRIDNTDTNTYSIETEVDSLFLMKPSKHALIFSISHIDFSDIEDVFILDSNLIPKFRLMQSQNLYTAYSEISLEKDCLIEKYVMFNLDTNLRLEDLSIYDLAIESFTWNITKFEFKMKGDLKPTFNKIPFFYNNGNYDIIPCHVE